MPPPCAMPTRAPPSMRIQGRPRALGDGSESLSSSTFGGLYGTPTAVTGSGPAGATSNSIGLPSDVFVWIFILVASGLVLLSAVYRVWRLRQLNRSMNTFFHPLRNGSLQGGPSPYLPPAHPLHPDHAVFFTGQAAYPPPVHGRTRVRGADVDAGGRRGGGAPEGKEDLPPYERGTLPGYGEAVPGWAGGIGTQGEVEMNRLDHGSQ